MKMYLRATGNISAQKTYGDVPFLEEIVEHVGIRYQALEPDYKDIIDPKMIRRMSRIIRMGVAAATACLKGSGITVPDAIITGTAYGCLQDTDVFLTKMVEQNEELLTPTAFIQSTHNTIGAQIGLFLKSHNYNNAFVHRGFSFESAMLDGMMQLMDNSVSNVLVGAIDEITDSSHAILKRFNLYRKDHASSKDLYKSVLKGTVAGEGATFFLLTNEPSTIDLAELKGMSTFYKPTSIQEIQKQIMDFLSAHSMQLNDIDLIITGKNGDLKDDAVYTELEATVFNNSMLANYKNLCGEYPTATAFALWLAARMVKAGKIPSMLEVSKRAERNIKTILIYNHYQNTHHSLFLVSSA